MILTNQNEGELSYGNGGQDKRNLSLLREKFDWLQTTLALSNHLINCYKWIEVGMRKRNMIFLFDRRLKILYSLELCKSD